MLVSSVIKAEELRYVHRFLGIGRQLHGNGIHQIIGSVVGGATLIRLLRVQYWSGA